MVFYEIRVLVSTSILIYQWYLLGIFDNYLHYLACKELRKIAKLPVSIDKVIVKLEGHAYIYGIKVKVPPIEEDSRWDLEYIVTVDLIKVDFPFFIAFAFFQLSFQELAIMRRVEVHGLRIYLEGFHREILNQEHGCAAMDVEGSPSIHYQSSDATQSQKRGKHNSSIPLPPQNTIYNITLIGKIPPKPDSTINSTQVSQKYPEQLKSNPIDLKYEFSVRNLGMETVEIIEDYFVNASGTNDIQSDLDMDFSCSYKERSSSTNNINTNQNPNDHHTSLSLKLLHFKENLSQKYHEIKEIIHENGGIYNATKSSLHQFYSRTKHSIEEKIQDKIYDKLYEIHKNVSGEEPFRLPGELRVLCDEIIYYHIEIYLLRILPISLRYLEDKPLIVENLHFQNVGYPLIKETLTMEASSIVASSLVNSAVLSSSASMIAPLNNSNLYSSVTSGKYTMHGQISDKRRSSKYSFPSQTSQFSTPIPENDEIQPLSASISTRSMLETPSSKGNLIASQDHVNNYKDSNLSNMPELSSETPIDFRQINQSSEENTHSITNLTMQTYRNIDVYEDGMHARQFKYHFERQMLFSLFKHNAGKFILWS